MAEENPFEQYRNIPPSSPAAAGSGGTGDNQFKDPLPPGYDPITRRPFQYAGNAPPGDPVAQSTGRPIREDLVPGAGTQAVISMSTDREQQRRIAAARLFPDMKPEEAEARVFYGPNGRLAAVGFNGQAFYVDPDFRLRDPATYAPSAARLAGPALPAVGGVAGGFAGAPTSLVMGPLGAGIGAGAGDVVRQEVARRYDPQGAAQPYNYGQTATEVVGATVGQAGGATLARVANPNRLAISPIDQTRINANPLLMQMAEQHAARARAEGVTLTPGQASGLPSLLQHEDVISSGSVGAERSDIAKQFYDQQRRDLVEAATRRLDTVSPQSDKTDAALQFQQGAEDATRVVRQQANAQARPAYQAAERGGNVMSPDLAQLSDAPAVQNALRAARTEYENLYRRPAPETPDFALWDLAKRKLDDTVTVARRAGENTTVMSVDRLRGDLLSALDDAFPTYAQARTLAAPGQRLAARLEETVGRTSADTGTERARAIVAPVFESNNARAIAEARDAFVQAGRGAEWDAGTRAYLQDIIDKASKSQEGLNPQALRQQLWADPDRRAAIRAAMDPAAFQGLENFMGVVERVAQSRGMNSLTAPRQAGAVALQEQAAQAPVARAAGALERTAQNPLRMVSGPFGVVARWSQGRAMTGIAERLFSPEGMTYLRQMSGVSPLSQQALASTAEFLGQQAADRVAPDVQANPLLR